MSAINFYKQDCFQEGADDSKPVEEQVKTLRGGDFMRFGEMGGMGDMDWVIHIDQCGGGEY